MANLEGWKPKQEWKKEGKNFLVSVTKHLGYDGENKWCVYLYVYPKHPAFARFNRDGDMFNQPYFECHSYISYFRVNINWKTNGIESYQLGWDYNHDGDSYYSSIDSVDQAGSIFYDAERLFEQAMSWYEDVPDNIS